MIVRKEKTGKPKMVMLKVLQQYYTATGDQRVIKFMSAYFDYQQKTLKSCPVGKWTEWATSRGADNAMMIQWLYGITKDPSLLDLASLVQSQSFTWSEWFGKRDWVINAAAYQDDKAWMTRHGVNVAMALKDPVVNYERTADQAQLKNLHTGFHDLMTLHGLPMAFFRQMKICMEMIQHRDRSCALLLKQCFPSSILLVLLVIRCIWMHWSA